MFPKLLLLLLILAVAWYGLKFVTRVGQVRQAVRRAAEYQARAAAAGARPRQAIVAEDLVKCRACGAFVPVRSATACGRGDCPY